MKFYREKNKIKKIYDVFGFVSKKVFSTHYCILGQILPQPGSPAVTLAIHLLPGGPATHLKGQEVVKEKEKEKKRRGKRGIEPTRSLPLVSSQCMFGPNT